MTSKELTTESLGKEFSLKGAVKGIIIGAGKRGICYSKYALNYPEEFVIVGVAEINSNRRSEFQKKFNLTDERCFDHWKKLTVVPKFADCVLICTQDRDHADSSIALAKKGYHILLEKPMAVTPTDCRSIVSACKENSVKLSVCHVLRYHPSVLKLKELIDCGAIGDVVNINHTEPVGFWHFAHSFVRGNWCNEFESSFSLLTKCCHDIDLIYYWMGFQNCVKLSSFGSLFHFRKENKPSKAGDRCLECCIENSCPYSAKKIYLDRQPFVQDFARYAACDIEDTPERYMDHLTEALKTGPYGKCIYGLDNNVCDNQVVNFQFEDGSTATLTMIAFSKDLCERKTVIYGTRGELRWDAINHYILHFDFLSGKTDKINCIQDASVLKWGHGGADFYTMKTFIDTLKNKSKILTGPDESLASHLLTFAAEHSRITGKVINPSEDANFK